MKRLWALLIGMVLFGAVLFYWAGSDQRKIPEFRKLDSIEKQVAYTGRLVTALNLGYNGPRKEVDQLEDAVINSTEYMLRAFHDELEERPTLHVRVLQDLAYQYGVYKQNYDKGEGYRQKYESVLANNRESFITEDYKRIKLGALMGRASMYFHKKEYEKVVEANLKIIELFPYSFSSITNKNLWIAAYNSIWRMYNDRIGDYDKALYYAKEIAIDPRNLPKDRIGLLGGYEVSYEQKLANDAENNQIDSMHKIQSTYSTFGKYKELQQLMVDSNESYEIKYGCSFYNGIDAVEDLYKSYKKHGVLVPYNYRNIYIFYPRENSFGCASKIGSNKYKYTEIFSRDIHPRHLEFLENGNIKVLTASVLSEVNERNSFRDIPEITEEELTKGWKREVRIIDDKELKKLFKRVP